MNFNAKEVSILLLGLALILAQVEATALRRHGSRKSSIVIYESRALKNLGKNLNAELKSGRPDFSPPDIMRIAMVKAVVGDWPLSQYSPSEGLLRLREAISKFYSKLIDRDLEPNNVLITIGATEALFTTLQYHTSSNPGGEWIFFEPAWFNYAPMIEAASGIPKPVALNRRTVGEDVSSSDWIYDLEELASAFNNRTRGIILNNPHNPTGKVFTLKELKSIARLAKKWNVIVICDEVFEFNIYDDNEHIRMATLPDMFDRTITISSSSKVFPATGYRVGWAYGNASLLKNLTKLHSVIVHSAPSPNQDAVAAIFEDEYKHFGTTKSYLYEFGKWAERQRNRLTRILTKFGMIVTVPQGGHFIVANWTKNYGDSFKDVVDSAKDAAFSDWLYKHGGINVYPMSGFYCSYSKKVSEDLLRITFIRSDESLEAAESLFQAGILTSKRLNIY